MCALCAAVLMGCSPPNAIQHPEELTAVSPAGDPQEPFREEQDSHSTSVGGCGRRKEGCDEGLSGRDRSVREGWEGWEGVGKDERDVGEIASA